MTEPAAHPPIFKRPGVTAVAVCVGLTAIQSAVPLIGVPGYEAAQAQALLLGLVAGLLATRRGGDGAPCVVPAAATATGILFVDTLLLFVVAALRGILCDGAASLLWFLVLPATTLILGAAWGGLVGTFVARRRVAVAIFVGIWIAHLLWELGVIWREPVTFVFDTLLGYFPGPVYDRAVRVGAALAASRAQAIALAVALLSVSALWRARKTDRDRVAPALLLLAGTAAFVALAVNGRELGASTARAWIEKELGGRVDGPHVTLIYPEDLRPDQVRLQLLDAEFRFAEQSAFLGLTDAPRMTAYFYRSASEKKRLMGAADTQFADCWSREMHMNLEDPPHSVLKHEIVHVLASPWGIKSLGFSPVLGVTEGLAVASEKWRDDWTVPEWAAAMKSVGRLPDVAAIAGPTGFWRLSGARSYLAWGGFITWLIQTQGLDHVRMLYGSGDFEKSFGRPVRDLAREWEVSLDGVQVPDDLARVAAYKFFRPSIFEGRCARLVGTLGEDGETAMERGRDRKAVGLFARALRLSGNASRNRRDLMEARIAARDLDGAEREAADIFEAEGAQFYQRPAPGEPVRGDLLSATVALATQARIAWLRGDSAAARAKYQDVLTWGVSESLRRVAAVAIHAIDTPALEAPLRRYLVDPDGDRVAWYSLQLARDAVPDDTVVRYLIGRRLDNAREYAEAAGHLRAALDAGLPDRGLAVEAWQTLGRALYDAGLYDEAIEVFETRLPPDASEGLRLEAAEWADRCRFAKGFDWGLVTFGTK